MQNILNKLWLTLVLAILALAAVWFYNRTAAPPLRIVKFSDAAPPDYDRIRDRIRPESLLKDLREITAPTSRAPGYAGCHETADFVRKELLAAGYEVFLQPVKVTVPVTRMARIEQTDGTSLRGIELLPFYPNGFRTATTPENGIVGKVLRAEKGLAREFEERSVRGQIVLLPLGTPWQTVAGMGAAAVLYHMDSTGAERTGSSWGENLQISADFPRFLVRGDTDRIAGETIRLKARVDFEQVTVTNIVGILPAAVGPGDEMIVAEAYYDSSSYVPDWAPGASGACGISALLSTARNLALSRDALRRHVVVLAAVGRAQALAGTRTFMKTVGRRGERAETLAELSAEYRESAEELESKKALRTVMDDGEIWTLESAGEVEKFWMRHPASLRDDFDTLYEFVLSEDLFVSMERQTEAQVRWVRAGSPISMETKDKHPLFVDYDEARVGVRRIQSLLRTRYEKALELEGSPLGKFEIPERMSAAIDEITQRAEEIVTMKRANNELALRLPEVENVLFLSLDITPVQPEVAIVCGEKDYQASFSPADSELQSQLAAAARELTTNVASRTESIGVRNLVRENDERGLGFSNQYLGSRRYFGSQAVVWYGHIAFALSTAGDNRINKATPFDTLERMLEPEGSTSEAAALENLTFSTRVIAGGLERLARGMGRIVPLQINPDLYSLSGKVVSRIGDDITPSQIMPGALVALLPKTSGGEIVLPPGGDQWIYTVADYQGKFVFENLGTPALSANRRWRPIPVSLDAALVDKTSGEIRWALSEQDSGRNGVFSVTDVALDTLSRITITPVLFRSQSMMVVPQEDPSSFQPYVGMGMMDARLLAQPDNRRITAQSGVYVHDVAPETRVLFTFRQGSDRNPNLTTVRAFALNLLSPDAMQYRREHPDSNIAGPGYLAADNPRLVDVEIDTALSMAVVNEQRIALQERHGMADRLSQEYAATARKFADQALESVKAGNFVQAKHFSLDSVAYSANVHPVIRRVATSAIVGILFYLMLAAPFAIFAEKLFVGHPDIRWRLGGQGVIFILFFLTLRILHPAYDLVRSPPMILLGFITFSLAIGIASFVSGRFKANLGILRRKLRDEIEVSDVSRSEAVGSAFVLGLGHLRKRAVRTALTTGTLVLTMFVMLAFTSVRTDIVDVAFPIGKAGYTGLLVRDRNHNPLAGAPRALEELYGEDFLVAPRHWQGAFQPSPGQPVERMHIEVTRETLEISRSTEISAVLGLTPEEEDVTGITQVFDVMTRWFESRNESSCFLPQDVSDALDITPELIRAGEARVVIGGAPYQVLGTFDPRKLERFTDLDGESLLPVDILATISQAGQQNQSDDATELPTDVPRLPGDLVAITPASNMPGASQAASVAVRFAGLDFRQSHEIITRHLERTGQIAWYGLDGTAFYGGKMRRSSLSGMLDMILPIIIAALAVLNTMRGSVYERRDELYVFNAVGLAPRHIRALFMAEASVYAVIGAVGGYILAQGLGKIMAVFGIITGLNMSYTSLAVVFVTLLLMVVVYLSSLAPARMAAKLAVPAETLTREVKTSEGDVIELELPFLFNRRDRLAVMPYFADWFDNHGEGSAGPFFCSVPEAGLRKAPTGEIEPLLRMTVWLKPYDLGVSQILEIFTRHEPESGDIAACVTLTRQTGDVRSWERCAHAFIGMMRQRFLTWRAVDSASRERLFTRAIEMFDGESPKN